MRETMKQEQGGFGFIPILFVAVVVAFTAAVLIIGWIWSWVHLREREQGVVVGCNVPAQVEIARAVRR